VTSEELGKNPSELKNAFRQQKEKKIKKAFEQKKTQKNKTLKI